MTEVSLRMPLARADLGSDRPSCCVAICTRDRPIDLCKAVESVLSECSSAVPVIIIDQSTGDDTKALLQPLLHTHPNLCYFRHDVRGLSRARNAALAIAAEHEVLVFTDDDCAVRQGWLAAMLEPFVHPRVGIVFGNVVPIPVHESDGFVIGYTVQRERCLGGRLGKLQDGGIGASMAVRTAAARQIGLFDEMLGAGGHFPSCEDGDFAYRVLKADYKICHVLGATVDHSGLREWKDGPRMVRSTYFAVGAAYAKHLRCGDAVAFLLLGQQVLFCLGEIGRNAIRLRRPVGIRRLSSLLEGAVAGWRSPVDKTTALFLSRT